MRHTLSLIPSRRPGFIWFHRREEIAGTPKALESLRKTKELINASWSVLQRDDLSVGAKLLFCALRYRDEYVVCIEPRAIATQTGVSEQKVRNCLNELADTGAISSWLGNLVFFD